MKNKLLTAHNHGVAGVIAPLKPDNNIGMFCQQINDLALAFITPLGADYDYVSHLFTFLM
jgi:hypothetical protein